MNPTDVGGMVFWWGSGFNLLLPFSVPGWVPMTLLLTLIIKFLVPPWISVRVHELLEPDSLSADLEPVTAICSPQWDAN